GQQRGDAAGQKDEQTHVFLLCWAWGARRATPTVPSCLASDRSWPRSRFPQTARAWRLSRYDVRRIFRYMEALRHRDVARLLAFVHDAAELESRLPVPPEFVARLSEFVPAAETVTYCELDWEGRRVAYEADQLAWARDPDVEDAYWELKHQHAVCEYFARTGDFPAAYVGPSAAPRVALARALQRGLPPVPVRA